MPDEYASWDRSFGGDRRAPRYEGLTLEEARERAAADGVRHVRVADWDEPGGTVFTADLRSGRLNLLIHHGRVTRAGFG